MAGHESLPFLARAIPWLRAFEPRGAAGPSSWPEDTQMLELRPNCEWCDRDLPPDSEAARICSYECTFCADCVERHLHDVCPNCGGGFAPRPIRPRTEWRKGVSLAHQPPSTGRRSLKYDSDDIAAHVARIRDIPPARR